MGRDGTVTTTIYSTNNNSSSSNSNMMNNSMNTSISTSDTGAIGTCMMGAPAQTASIGYSDMMTFLPEGSNGAEQAQQQQQQQADEDEIAQFSASLDELLATATTMATTQTNAVAPQGEIAQPPQQVTAINPPPPQAQTAMPAYFNVQQAQQQPQQSQGPIITAAGTSAVHAPSTGYTTTSLEQSCVSSFPFGIAQPPAPHPPPGSSQTSWPPTSNAASATPSTATTSAATNAATNSFPAVTTLPIAATGISYPPLPSNPYNPPWSAPAQPTAQAQTPAQQPQQSWNPSPPGKRTRKAATGTKRRAASMSPDKKTQQLPVLTTPMTTPPTMGIPQPQSQIKAVSEYDDSGTDDPSTSTSKRKYSSYSTPSPNTPSFMNPNNVTSATSISESEKSKKRRQDRNLREQERAHRITAQISHLRNVLASANIRFKPDKYSTLISVVEYIKTLQRRSALLDEEHRKLLDTISRTGEMVNGIHHSQQKPGGNPTGTVNYDSAAVVTRSTATTTTSNDSATTANPTESTTASASSTSSSSVNDELMVFVRGLDYKSIFSNCGVALGVASVDGRFVDANDEFVYWSGYTREELLGTTPSSAASTSLPPSSSLSSCSSETSTQPRCMGGKHLSLFNLLSREDMERVFSAMSKMLKSTSSSAGAASGGDKDKKDRGSGGGAGGNDPGGGAYVDEGNHWTGIVRKSRRRSPDIPLRLNITMVRSSDGRPKFFNCALTPEDDA